MMLSCTVLKFRLFACGIYHSDMLPLNNIYRGPHYSRVLPSTGCHTDFVKCPVVLLQASLKDDNGT